MCYSSCFDDDMERSIGGAGNEQLMKSSSALLLFRGLSTPYRDEDYLKSYVGGE